MAFDPNKYLQEKTQTPQAAAPAFDPQKYLAEKLAPPQQPESTQGEALIEGVGKGATFGLLPYAQAGTEKIINKIAGFEDTPLSTLVQQYRDRGAQLRADNPWTTGVGEVIGGIAPGAALSKGIAMAGAKILPQAVQNLGYSAQVASNAGPIMPKLNALGKIAKGAGEGAIMAGAYTPDQGADLEQRLEQAKIGATIGGAIPASVEGVKGLYSGAKTAALKGFSAVTGVNEDAIKAFYANPQKYLDAPTKEQVVERMQKVVNQVHDDIERGAVTVQDAKEQLREMAYNLKSNRTEASRIARETLRDSERNLNDAYGKMVNELKAKPAPTSLQPQVSDAMSQLKQKVIQGSNESYDILAKDPSAYGVQGAAKVLRGMADDMNIQPWKNEVATNGSEIATRVDHAAPLMQPSPPVTAESRAVQGALRSFADMLEQTPQAVPAKELKKIIQQIDNSGRAHWNDPGFDTRVSEAYKLVRKVVDEGIKNKNPEYRDKMLEVARQTGILDEALTKFGTPDATISKLSSVSRPQGKLTIEALQKLGNETGNDFVSPINDYVQTQRLLKSPEKLTSLKQGLPQYAENQSALAQAAKAKRMSDPREIKRLVENSIENRSLNVAKEGLEKSQALKSELPGWTRFSVDKKVSAAMRNMDDPAIKKQIDQISKLGDADFTEMINQLKINKAFTGSRINGSRRSVVGAAGGLVTGNPVLGFIGSATGYMLDLYGPKVAKQALIALKNIEGSPTVQSLMKAGNFTQKVAQDLANALEKGAAAPASQAAESSAMKRRLGQQEQGREDNYAGN